MTVENKGSIEENMESSEKPSYWGFGLSSVIFAYNSYAIVHNLIVKDGYTFIGIAIAVNIGIGFYYASQFEALFPRIDKKVSYGILVAMLVIGGLVGYSEASDNKESAVIDLVNQILTRELGAQHAKCLGVSIGREIKKNFYKATAFLDNGNDLPIMIEEKANNMIYVSISL